MGGRAPLGTTVGRAEKAFPLLQARARGEFDITEFDREDMVIVGTPDECLRKFIRYDDAGVDQLLCYVNFGYLPHEAIMKSIELLGTRVIPELQKRGRRRLAAGLADQLRAAEHKADTQAMWKEGRELEMYPD